MNCAQATDLFSDHLEGELSAEESGSLEQHLEGCAVCHSSFESFRYALGDLQSLSLRETSRTEVGAIMAAVDRSSLVQGRPKRTALTHMLAAGIGAVLVWLFWPQEVRIEERIVAQRVEVPVEVFIDVPVERLVQVEVPVEVRVEVPIEVPVEVERVVTVAHPLQADVDRFLAFGDVFIELAELAASHAESQQRTLPDAETTPFKPTGAAMRVAGRSRRDLPARVVRTGNQVSLETRGSTSEVVPALIAMLSSNDARTRRVVEGRLESYRRELGGALPGSNRGEPERELTGFAKFKAQVGRPSASDEPAAKYSLAESWQAWWGAQGGQVAVVHTLATH